MMCSAYVSALGWGQFWVNGALQDTGTLGVGWTKVCCAKCNCRH